VSTFIGAIHFHFTWDNRLSLSEDDSGLLYRTGIVAGETIQITEKIWAEASVRLDIANNLERFRDFRPRAALPVRSDEDLFAERGFGLERSYLGWITTLKPDLHFALKAGYLEEMYAGAGGEILYRPFGRNFALGGELWQVFKRDPFSAMNNGFTGDSLLSGHLQGWYEFPNSNTTLQARFGRYLAEDIGATLALNQKFNNGSSIEAFATLTDNADFDLFGGTSHLYSGVKMRLPLGNILQGRVPGFQRITGDITTTIKPLGRDTGQALDTPSPLYELSEPLSYRHLGQYWNNITD
jgi:hypothetical protein